MRRALPALAAAVCGCHAAKPTAPPRMEVLLDEVLAKRSGIGALIDSLDVAPSGLLVLADPSHVVFVGWGGVDAVEGASAVTSFAFTGDGLLLAVHGHELSYLGGKGELEPLFDLPDDDMAIAPGAAGSMYLFDRSGAGEHHGLYELTAGRQVRELIDTADPIDAVAAAGARLFVATGGALFELTPGKPVRLVAHHAGAPIRSVAADVDHDAIYFSDGTSVFRVRGGRIALVTSELGGALRVRDGALFVLDPGRRLAVRFAGLP